MLELMVRLECKRQAFIRRRLVQNLGSGPAYWGIAGLIFFVSLFPMLIAAPAAVAVAPPAAGAVGGLVLAGFVLCATIVGAPIGLVLL
jgi:hypothetical protein